MKPTDQRYYQDADLPVGDCLRACISSIFEIPADDLPHFQEAAIRHKEHWWQLINKWAQDYGIGVNVIMYPKRRRGPKNWHPGYWIASVESGQRVPTGSKSSHAVVLFGGKVVHDPNPRSRANPARYWFLGEVWFEVWNPALWLQQVAK